MNHGEMFVEVNNIRPGGSKVLNFKKRYLPARVHFRSSSEDALEMNGIKGIDNPALDRSPQKEAKPYLRASRGINAKEMNARNGIDNAAVDMDEIGMNSNSREVHYETENLAPRGRDDAIEQSEHGEETSQGNDVERPAEAQQGDNKQAWNKAKIKPLESSKEADELCYKISKQILKAFTIIFMIPAMTALLFLSKGSLLIAVSNVKPYLHHSITQNTLPSSLSYSESLYRTTDIRPTTFSSSSFYSVESNAPNESSLTSSSSSSSSSLSSSSGSTSSEYLTSTVSPRHNFFSSKGSMTCRSYDKTEYRTVGNTTNSQISRVSKCVTIPHGFQANDAQFSCLTVSNSSNVIYTSRTPYNADQCFVMRNYWIWSLFLILCTPHVFVFIKGFWNILFKSKSIPALRAFLVVLATETLYSVGISLLTFLVLPSFNDAIDALLILLAVSVVPSILKFICSLKRKRKLTPGMSTCIFKQENYYVLRVCLNVISILIQFSAIIVWPINVLVMNYEANKNVAWALPVGLLLTSVRWWDNYYKQEKKVHVEENERDRADVNPNTTKKKNETNLMRQIEKGRGEIMFFVSLWNIGITVIMMMLCVSLQVEEMDPLYNLRPMNAWTAVFNFDLSWCHYVDSVTQEAIYTLTYNELPELQLDWVWVWLVNCSSSLFAYFFARSAAKMHLQRFCYFLPLLITTPLMFGLMIFGCELWNDQPCYFATDNMSGYLFYKCYEVDTFGTSVFTGLWYLVPLWWLSQLWITNHIWNPQNERLATAERLFVLPLYDSIVLEQSLLVNRRRDDAPVSHISKSYKRTHQWTYAHSGNRHPRLSHTIIPKNSQDSKQTGKDKIPFIYICATMWHETETEMISMLKSIFRLDRDQENKRKAYEENSKKEDTEYYEFEAHIFFDNAYSGTKVNEYVEKLVTSVTPAARAVYTEETVPITIPFPEKVKTPYGGRLIWKMPKGNKIIAHLKDSAKIRHKKRWSQVMYMYYFLGYKLHMDEELMKNENRLKLKAQSTFLLALDGDVDFEPLALQLVVDLMRRDPSVGAACGRIHPTGSGPMVWYQLFEYALGHWMQKSTEHVIGSVLCSPGCFSLFRGSALMDDNVMAKYTTKSTEPMHYIQYDQGEDRWLCTLLLQAGHRVEYCAASDSYTNAPEGFDEFFNQRRRWMPSTMANILDLLRSWRHTTKINKNISTLYILYQLIIFLASVVGPGTIFMMIVGAMDIALGDKMDFTWSLILNLVPVLIFILLCYCAKAKTQLQFAKILNAIYCLVQMLVLIGLILEMAKNGICFPTTIFFLFVAGSFILCGILHPQEFLCVLHGCTYYLAIPTMYMLLVIYALCNLNEVSWGTREVKKTETEKQFEEDKKKQDESEKKMAGVIGNVMKNVTTDNDGCSVGCGDFCGLTCCIRPVTSRQLAEEHVKIITDIEKLLTKQTQLISENYGKIAGPEDVIIEMNSMISMHQDKTTQEVQDSPNFDINNNEDIQQNDRESLPFGASASQGIHVSTSGTAPAANQALTSMSSSTCPNTILIQSNSPAASVAKDWSDDVKLGDGIKGKLDEEEDVFFTELIAEYLEPLLKSDDIKDEEQKKDAKIEEDKLTENLKDLKNSVSLSFLLINGVFVVVVTVLQMNVDMLFVPWPCGNNVKIEPLGFMFMLTFGVILIIQMSGMLLHRTSTFLHIISTTAFEFDCLKKSEEKVKETVRPNSANDTAQSTNVAPIPLETVGTVPTETVVNHDDQQTQI